MIAAIALAVALTAAPAGFDTVDGLVTEDDYNVTFANPYANFDAMEYLFGVPSEQYVEIDTSVPASHRPREFGGEELPTVHELLNLRVIRAILAGWYSPV